MGMKERRKLEMVKTLVGAHTFGEVRRKSVKVGVYDHPFAELDRREGAKTLRSSRIGEIKKADSPPKMGMGDVRREERRQQHLEEGRINRIAHRMVHGPKKRT